MKISITPNTLDFKHVRNAWSQPSLSFVLMLNAMVGLIFATYLLTGSFLRGEVSYFTWPDGDVQQYLTGGKYFIYDAWRFPLFVSALVERSEPQSMVFTDCIPLFALIAKIIYTLTGHEIPYLAWWYTFLIIAQPISFSLLLWFGGVRSLILQLSGGILSVLVPAFLYRVGHAPLMAHFTFITAIGLYFAATEQRAHEPIWPRWLRISWFALLLAVTMINMYLLLMVSAFFGAAVAQSAMSDIRERRSHLLIYRLSYAAMALAAIISLMYMLGFFLPYQGGGSIGFHSTNLLSPITPQMTTLFNNSLSILDATGGQYEGFNYFGAGILLFLLFAIVLGDGRPWKLLKRNPLLMLALVTLILLALSNVGYAGKLLLWSVPAPEIFGTFRSSADLFGRLLISLYLLDYTL